MLRGPLEILVNASVSVQSSVRLRCDFKFPINPGQLPIQSQETDSQGNMSTVVLHLAEAITILGPTVFGPVSLPVGA